MADIPPSLSGAIPSCATFKISENRVTCNVDAQDLFGSPISLEILERLARGLRSSKRQVSEPKRGKECGAVFVACSTIVVTVSISQKNAKTFIGTLTTFPSRFSRTFWRRNEGRLATVWPALCSEINHQLAGLGAEEIQWMTRAEAEKYWKSEEFLNRWCGAA